MGTAMYLLKITKPYSLFERICHVDAEILQDASVHDLLACYKFWKLCWHLVHRFKVLDVNNHHTLNFYGSESWWMYIVESLCMPILPRANNYCVRAVWFAFFSLCILQNSGLLKTPFKIPAHFCLPGAGDWWFFCMAWMSTGVLISPSTKIYRGNCRSLCINFEMLLKATVLWSTVEDTIILRSNWMIMDLKCMQWIGLVSYQPSIIF